MALNRLAPLNLRMKRINAGLSPEALGEQIGVAGDTIRRIERGLIPTPAIAYKVAQYLETEVTELWPELVHGDPERAA